MKHSSKVGIAILAVSAVGLAGCASSSEPSDSSAAINTVERTAAVEQPVTVRNPNIPYFADVIANGTGCPRGTWDVDLAPDGQVFTLTFSAYEANVYPRQLFTTKDCQIGLKLHSPQGLTYSVSEFYYSGYAFLDQVGMTAQQSAKYYFQGNPILNAQGRTALHGPYNNDYTYQDRIGIVDLVWSPCGVQRTLNIDSRITVQNNPPKTGTGYINTSSVNGSITLRFRLSWRHC